MIQERKVKKRSNDNLYDFMEFKKKKPFYRNKMKITLGNPINGTYLLIRNMVFMDKQILALKAEHDPKSIILVEARIEDGQLTQISRLPEEVLNYISRLYSGSTEYFLNQIKNEIYTEIYEF